MKKTITLSELAKQKSQTLPSLPVASTLPASNPPKPWPTLPPSSLSSASSSPSFPLTPLPENYLFKDVGLSTLMEISYSSIRSETNSQKYELQTKEPHTKGLYTKRPHTKGTDYIQQQLKIEVEEMRTKLQKIQEKSLPTSSINSHPIYSNITPQQIQEDKFVKMLRKEFMERKIEMLRKSLKKVIWKKIVTILEFCKEYDRFLERRGAKLIKESFWGWKTLVLEQGERRKTMELIKEKIIEKRKSKEFLTNLQKELNIE